MTSKLQGGKEAESARNIHCEPQVVSVVCGPRHETGGNALTSTLQKLGWRGHTLDQCVYMLYDKDKLVIIVGIYVDEVHDVRY